jgi:hypothetical protein
MPPDAGAPVPPDPEPQPSAAGWLRAPASTWQIQFTGNLDTNVSASVYDVDLFDTSAAQVAQLHAAGRKVICYFDTAYEPGRPDSAQLVPFRGNPISGWPGQYWLDVRQPGVLEVMRARIAQAQAKACDAVDADDIDARSNDPGFAITAQEQRAFVRALSGSAHASGLSFGMKNALEDVAALIDVVDFAVNEECFEYDECDALLPFTAAGKAVFQIEYTDGSLESKAADVCPRANALGFSTLIKRMDLNAERYACR